MPETKQVSLSITIKICSNSSFVEWMATSEMENKPNIFEKRNSCKCLFQRNRVALKILYHCKWSTEIILFLFNWYSLHARLNSYYEEWSYKKRKHKNVKAYRKSI